MMATGARTTKFILIPLLLFSFATLTGCEEKSNRLEENAVVLEFNITAEEAAKGVIKTVRAPDNRYFQLIVPKGVKNGTPLKLPPRVAKDYTYPLYFKVRIKR